MIKNIPIEKNNPETVFESYHNASHIPGSAFEKIQAQYYNRGRPYYAVFSK